MQLLRVDEVREYYFHLVHDVPNADEGNGHMLRVTISHPNYEPCSTDAPTIGIADVDFYCMIVLIAATWRWTCASVYGATTFSIARSRSFNS